MFRRKIAAGLMLAGSLLVANAAPAHAQVNKDVTVTGAGATFPLNIIEQWRADFKKSTGATVNYTGVGSGAGRTQLINGTVDFAGSDVLAPAAQVTQLNSKYKGGFVYIAEIAGAIGITYKVKGVPGGIKLTPSDLGKIFSGKVQYWDDKVITDDNPGQDFPHTPMQVFIRSDSSGTSGNFSAYLDKTAGSDWTYGEVQQFPNRNQQIGRAGSDGVATAVAGSNGGITYTEISFIRERALAQATIQNAAGQFAYADERSAAKTIDDSTVNKDGSVSIAFNTKTPGAYPIAAVTYFIVPVKMASAKLANFKEFMGYVLGDGQKKATKLSYVPLPPKMITAAKAQLAKLQKK